MHQFVRTSHNYQKTAQNRILSNFAGFSNPCLCNNKILILILISYNTLSTKGTEGLNLLYFEPRQFEDDMSLKIQNELIIHQYVVSVLTENTKTRQLLTVQPYVSDFLLWTHKRLYKPKRIRISPAQAHINTTEMGLQS